MSSNKSSYTGFLSTVRPLKTKSVSLNVRVFPSIAFELYVYSTINYSLSLAVSPISYSKLALSLSNSSKVK